MSTPNRKNQHRWSNKQCVELLEAIVDKIKDNPEGFEKPTAHKFYSRLFEAYTLPDTAELGILVVKNKLRNLKTSFIKAEEWKAQTGAGLLEEGKEQSVKEYINKICPQYDLLEEIFGQRKNINLPPIYDSTQDNMEVGDNPDDIFYLDNSNVEITLEEDVNLDVSNNVDVVSLTSDSGVEKIKKQLSKSGSKKAGNSSLQYLQSLQVNRNELDQLKLNQQIKTDKDKMEFEEIKWQKECEFKTISLEIEKEKVELEKLKIQGELELKKLQIEKDFELKKYELELKYQK